MDSWLAIEKAKEIPDALSFFGISTVEQYLGFGASHRSALSFVSTDDGKWRLCTAGSYKRPNSQIPFRYSIRSFLSVSLSCKLNCVS
jgi:hypothetical protein